jgi:hypothetical protein
MLPILFIIVSGLFAQSSDVVPTPERMEQLLNDSTIEQQSQPVLEQDAVNKDVVKKNKAKALKNKKLKTKKIKTKELKSKKLKAKKIKAINNVEDKEQPITGGEGSNE